MINGKARSGKDTFADMLMKELMVPENEKSKLIFTTKIAIAEPLKEICRNAFQKMTGDINHVIQEFCQYEIWRKVGFYKTNNQENNNYLDSTARELCNKLRDLFYTDNESWFNKKNIITRGLLQNVGTEIFREQVSQNYWIDKCKERISSLSHLNDYILISDWRYYNEYKEILKYVNENPFMSLTTEETKVITIQVRRDPSLLKNFATTEGHSSEGEALPARSLPTFTIDNNGTLEELKTKAKEIAKRIKNKDFGKQTITLDVELPGVKTYNDLVIEEKLENEIKNVPFKAVLEENDRTAVHVVSSKILDKIRNFSYGIRIFMR